MTVGMTIAAVSEVQMEILQVFEQVTRYPRDVIDPNANLEEDLGIDSVKLGEIFSVLREKYALPDKLDMPREQLKTISGISTALHGFLATRPSTAGPENGTGGIVIAAADSLRQAPIPLHMASDQGSGEAPSIVIATRGNGHGNGAAVLLDGHSGNGALHVSPAPAVLLRGAAAEVQAPGDIASPPPLAPPPPAPASLPASFVAAVVDSDGEVNLSLIRQRVLDVFADVTRYPVEILSLEASLEEDLGIDSVKLGEIFSVLRERYHLPEKIDIGRDDVRTVGRIADAFHRLALAAHVASVPRPSVPVPVLAHGKASRSNGGGTLAWSAGAAAPVVQRPLAGKIGFISGSGRGLGQDIAMHLADQGATVIVNSFHSRERGEETVRQIKDRGGDAIHLWGSMANPAHLHQMFDRIAEKYGVLDFFVSNASNGMLAPIEEVTVEHWEKAFRTNVVGLHQGAVRAAQLMKKRGGGKIITLSSPAAHGYVEYFSCMGAVKAAVESLTKSMAVELARFNIQVNCVSPGPIDGELLRKWPESERLVAEWKAATPGERLCEPQDVSHFIAYLLNDAVKSFTGSILVLDRGISSRGW